MTDQETKKLFSLDADPTDVIRVQSDVPSDATNGNGESSEKEPFDPYKYQRITIPPDLRAEIIQYSRQNKDRPPAEDTLPPNRVMASAAPSAVVADEVADTNSADQSREETAIDLVSPATKRSSFKHPSRSLLLAGIALGVAVTLAIFAAAERKRPYSADFATATTVATPAEPVVGITEKPEPASPAPTNEAALLMQNVPQPFAPLPVASERSKPRPRSVTTRLQTSSAPRPVDAPLPRAPSSRKTSPFDAPLAEDAK